MCIIGTGARLHDRCRLDENVKIHSDPDSNERSVIGSEAVLTDRVRIGQGTTVGASSQVGNCTHVGPENTVGDRNAIRLDSLKALRDRINHVKRASVAVIINASTGTCGMLPIATGYVGVVVRRSSSLRCAPSQHPGTCHRQGSLHRSRRLRRPG